MVKNQNILIIGDLHEPFCLKEYLNFCKGIYKKYKCNQVIFIGDLLDNHYSSYHETDPNGMGGGEELALAVERLSHWYKAFPNADVTTGNHDRMIMRKAQTSNVPREWIKSYQEVLGVPKWNFVDEVIYNDVLYIHGEGVTARTKALRDGMSTVQGHRHTEGYVWFNPSGYRTTFGMQVGCGMDSKSYAAAYAKHFPSPALGCGVVLNNGKTPIYTPMI